jgi:hypothetical protein
MWISVHEQILGGKLRKLSKLIDCSQNEAIGILIRLWLWGINNADNNGKIIGAEIDDIADILSVGLSKDLESLDVAESLIEAEWIDSFGEELYIHDWIEWQGQWGKLQELKKQNSERQRRYRERQRDSSTEQPIQAEELKPKKPNK